MGYTPPYLEVRKITGGWAVYPSGATTDDLTIYSNLTDSTASLKLLGLGGIAFDVAAGQYLYLKNAGNIEMQIQYVTPDLIIEELTANKNIYLKTNGTGVVKFGSYTAGAATDSTGYITILDAAGNTRKLMVQA